MSNIREKLIEALELVKRLQRELRAADCEEAGHEWVFAGGTNAGCSDDCSCSVPVYECWRCGDSDYGDNEDAKKYARNVSKYMGGVEMIEGPWHTAHLQRKIGKDLP